MKIPSYIPTFTVTSLDRIINKQTDFNFVFTTKNFIPKGAKLELIFPDSLPLNKLILLSIQGISKIKSLVNYSISKIMFNINKMVKK